MPVVAFDGAAPDRPWPGDATPATPAAVPVVAEKALEPPPSPVVTVAPREDTLPFDRLLARTLELARGRLVSPDRTDEAAVAPPDSGSVQALLVAQDGRRAVDPAEGHAHVRPERLGRLQALRQDHSQPRQLLRGPLFTATRSRLAATAASRSTSFNPDASRGGRPSSVNAERTAAQ